MKKLFLLIASLSFFGGVYADETQEDCKPQIEVIVNDDSKETAQPDEQTVESTSSCDCSKNS